MIQKNYKIYTVETVVENGRTNSITVVETTKIKVPVTDTTAISIFERAKTETIFEDDELFDFNEMQLLVQKYKI